MKEPAVRPERSGADGAAESKGPKAFIVPHAGYIYSGPTAACAYAQVPKSIRRVVLLGPSHFVGMGGLALPDAQALATPLGEIPVDAEGAAAALELEQVQTFAHAHAREHSLEVQLPFLQRILPEFTLVPLVVGWAPPETVAQVIDALWGGPETLVLISSDLSHYLDYDSARRTDAETARRILALDAEPLESENACGHEPVNGMLFAARRRGLAVRQLDLRNSGDTAGDKSRVVGYGAFSFTGAGSKGSTSQPAHGTKS